jgi:hypothetical protein
MKRSALLLLAALPVIAFACGGDDDSADAADETTTTAASASACDVVGDTDAAATSDLDVTLDEWTVRYEGDGADAGAVKLVVHNEGDVEHELAIKDPSGKLIGEIEPFASGSTCEGTYELSATGTYALVCDIVDEDGMSHASHGMKADLIVK